MAGWDGGKGGEGRICALSPPPYPCVGWRGGGDGKMGISPPPRPKNIEEEEGIAKSIVIAGTLTAEGDSGGGKICRENAHLTVNAVCERKSNLSWSVRLLIFLCLRGRRRGIKFGLFPFPLRLKSLSLSYRVQRKGWRIERTKAILSLQSLLSWRRERAIL